MVVPVKFINACAASDDIFMIATIPDGLPDEVEFTRLYYLNPSTEDIWHYRDWPNHQVVSVCVRRERGSTRRAGCALTGAGDVELANSAGQSYEKIAGAGLASERALGDVTRIREIGSTLFACGGSGQVYKRDNIGWMPIDDDLVAIAKGAFEFPNSNAPISNEALRQLTQTLRRLPSLNDIDGSDESDVYVCGNGGNLFHFNGASWNKIALNTDAILTSIHCVSSDEIWVVGQDGTILVGNARTGFRNLGEFFPGGYIWSVRYFKGRIYLGTLHGLYVLDGSNVRLVSEGKLHDQSQIIAVDSFSDAVLWIATDRHAFRYDGNTFAFFEHADNLNL